MFNNKVISETYCHRIIALNDYYSHSKTVDGTNVKRITIDSPVVDVNVFYSTDQLEENVVVHLHGNCEGTTLRDKEFLDVHVVNHELRITLILTDNSYSDDLKLDVILPFKSYKKIIAKSLSANISLKYGIYTKHLKVLSVSGKLDLNLRAKEDINVEIFYRRSEVGLSINEIDCIAYTQKQYKKIKREAECKRVALVKIIQELKYDEYVYGRPVIQKNGFFEEKKFRVLRIVRPWSITSRYLLAKGFVRDIYKVFG